MNVHVIIRYVIGFLGLFEFFMVGKIAVASKEELKKLPLYPSDFTEAPNKYLLLIFTFYLGLLRFMWATTTGDISGEGKGFWLWLGVVLTQLGETVFFLTLATLPHFNRDKDPLVPLLMKIAQGKTGTKEGRTLLIIVSVITALVFFHGPPR